jgi:hypothetical protein
MAGMPPREKPPDVPSALERARGLAEFHLARTDLQAVVQGAFMEELLGLPGVTAELDRIDELVDALAARPDSEISDEAINVERGRHLGHMVDDLKLTWPWFCQQLKIGFWWRGQLVGAERLEAERVGRPPSTPVPAWPPKWTGDRRALVAGGSPWAVIDWELAPRLVMKRGDSLDALQRRWKEISARVEEAFRSSMFSSFLDEGPPGGAPRDDVAAYDRYARWAARKLGGGESYRSIAVRDLRTSVSVGADSDRNRADEARERWREVRRGVRKAVAVLDSI